MRFDDIDYDIPRPDKRYSDGRSITFLGRLLNQILILTKPQNHVYIDSCKSFYNTQKKNMTISMKNISLLHKCIGASGMNGLDKLLSFWILKKMKT